MKRCQIKLCCLLCLCIVAFAAFGCSGKKAQTATPRENRNTIVPAIVTANTQPDDATGSFVRINGGTFTMGCPDNEPAYNTGAAISDNTAWYSANSGETTHPVGQKKANPLGLFDMYGNVSEWCWDWYGDYPSEEETDPVGLSSGRLRIYRGGGFFDPADEVRSAFRNYLFPSAMASYIGFCLVRPL